MGSFFIKCDEATLIGDKTQYGEANFFEKIKLSFHIMTCKHCKVYTEQNTLVTKVMTYKTEEKSDKYLSKEEKKEIKKTLDKSL